jgi:hypothetical protein
MRLATTDAEAAADFVLVGALSFGPFPAGDENIVQVRVLRTTGGGPRGNLYADSMGFGTGNQLVLWAHVTRYSTGIPRSTPPLPPSSSNTSACFAAHDTPNRSVQPTRWHRRRVARRAGSALPVAGLPRVRILRVFGGRTV